MKKKKSCMLDKPKAHGLLKYVETIGILKQNVCGNLIALGGLLHEIREQKVFKEQFETFEEFLGSPEVSMSRAMTFKAMAIYVFLDAHKIKHDEVIDIDPDKIYRVIKIAEKEGIEEWLEKARILSRSDLANEVREKIGLPPHDPAKKAREYVKEFLYEFCPEKKIEPDDLALEDLLVEYEEWRKI